MASKKSNIWQPLFNKPGVKWVLTIVSICIGSGTIFYTNFLVEQLKEREKQQIELFAKTLEYTINEESGSNIYFITDKILFENKSIPTILTNETGDIIDYRNIAIDSSRHSLSEIQKRLSRAFEDMKNRYEAIPVTVRDGHSSPIIFGYVYYSNSFLLKQLTYYPYVQLAVIALFGFIAYLAFSYSKSAEQNRVWVGLAKETAHQLGTPISSLMAWMELLREDPDMKEKNAITELDKDIRRLQIITERFSSIGSVPALQPENINQIITNGIQYLRPRISSRVSVKTISVSENIMVMINTPLFDWVIENLIKNAVDAMGGEGAITISILRGSERRVFIDVSDNGKGIPKSKIKEVFKPGYTSKKRGWGLGLTLAKRIIEIYHNGKIFVLASDEINGTTFRISLPST
ncbi:MAG: HAMP domain-containing histidine kinase [Cyclobacteriaceae bacterium]|nr:HAMP domain-containing histidine kinase [Cyclobacteriaceae bacterium]